MSKTTVGLVIVASLTLAAGVIGATSVTEKPTVPVIRISVEMIQLDAVVTDKKGRHVTNLSPADFEVRQDGKVQSISRLAYYNTAPSQTPQAAPADAPTAPGTAQATPLAAEAPQSAPLTVVFVIDDLGLGPDGFVQMRRAMRNAVKQLSPTDRVAIVSTAKGFSSLAPTTDRKANLTAVEELRRKPWSRGELANMGSPQSTFFYLQHGNTRYDGGAYDDWDNRLVLQSLGVIKMTIKALQPLPGRKALLLVSEGFSGLSSLGGSQIHDIYWPLDRLYGDADDIQGAIKRLADFSARAAVVIHAVDPRGLLTTGISASDSVPDATAPGRLAQIGLSRSLYLQHSQSTLENLTDETGGLAVLNTNDVSGAVSKIMSDLSGYYLIGYEPGPQTFTSGLFHDVDVKVKRPDLKVRTRKGFYAVTDDQVAGALR